MNDQMYSEIYTTVSERIRELASGDIADLSPHAKEYFYEAFNFAGLLCDTWEVLEHAEDLDNAELSCINRRLYVSLFPDNYKNSYVNPSISAGAFGTETGRLMCAAFAELRAAIPALYERNPEDLVIRLSLIMEIYSAFVCALEDDEEVSATVLHDILYSYAYDYWPVQTYNKVRAQLCPESAFIRFDMASENMNRRADDVIRKMYLTGEYVSDNEIAMAKKLCAMKPDDLKSMADTYTSGYIKGFEVTGRDLSIKDTAELRFNISFIPMMVMASRNLKEAGLKCSMMRAGYSLFTGRSVDKNGYFGANPNPQYDLDHKNDLSLILDENLNKRRLKSLKDAYEKLKTEALVYAGPAVVDIFGEPDFTPVTKEEAADYTADNRMLVTAYASKAGAMVNEYIPGEERSFTIIAFPMPSVSDDFDSVFDATVRINTLDYELYRDIQQKIIDVLDTAEFVHVKGCGANKSDLKVHLHDIKDPSKETKFENCVADVNIPVGEVFTSPVLDSTTGTLHVTHVFLNGIEYHDLCIEVNDGMITGYSCAEGAKLIEDNILYHHETLPMGECAIGTNTTAYVLARKYGIEAKLPILIAEKTGPHFAFGDTCYSHSEDLKVYNPDGKEIIARDNECSLLRDTDPEKAYFNCHTDITIPYDELGELSAVKADGDSVTIIKDGRFVLPGCEELNRPFDE
ncbi:MAG: aminopeptidase [Lachnospiraceae bacterium]|nr:aminopeptidase [Lachnospiraceae bacterium]